MKPTPQAPAPNVTPERALERMKEFARRIIAVPKVELPTKRKRVKRKHG